ncbi:formyltetrahydrofolate deformylase [Nocardia sp. R16R-3T]
MSTVESRVINPALVDHACVIVQGRDRPGIVAEVAGLIVRHKANVISLDHYSTKSNGGELFQRIVFHRPDFAAAKEEIEEDLRVTFEPLGMKFALIDQSILKRTAILASTSDHCLLDLLWRHRRGELPIAIQMVISNHTITAEDVRSFGVPFFHVPSRGSNKSQAEENLLKLLLGNVDLVVLARYMQILSAEFLERLAVPVINIHHSFLPAFIGAGPYRKAKERGVKLIGATAHYVTQDLDEGPIIEQDVVRVTHADSVADLQQRGADVERAVLSRAVLWHAQDRVMCHGNQTITF